MEVVELGKQKCIKINLNNTYDEKNFPIKEGQLKDGNSRIGFSPLSVLRENKPRRKFWRSARTMVMFVDGAMNALHFVEATEELETSWGKDEAKSFVKKMVALSLVEMKPIKMWQFAIIMLLLILAIIIGFANIIKLGALGV